MKLAKPNLIRYQAQAVMLVGVIIISASSGFLGGWMANRHQTPLSTSGQKEVILSESNLISQIAQTVGPSVVSINVVSPTPATRLFSASTQESAGTGFVVSGDVIITNRHVIPADINSVNVVLSDGTKLEDVSVIGRTSDSDPLDVAFLKVKNTKGKTLKPVKLGDSTKMQVGDKVVAIGNALGQFQNTVTSGIISGFGRDVEAGDSTGGGSTEQLQDLFQTDAAINEGNSGGPLVNINGEVIGINTAIAGGAQNIGFSIPINDVNAIIKSVLATGKLQRPYLGVHYISITDDYAAANNLPVKRGAYIPPGADNVVPGSPAAAVGLQPGDIITRVNDVAIDESHSLSTVLGRFAVGQKVNVTIMRAGKAQVLAATLAAAPQN